MGMVYCRGCGKQIHETAVACPSCGAQQSNTVYGSEGDIPPGIRGWSWGAFLLNWIWAIGNRTWIGLLAVIPYVGFIVAIWLGIKGREMAWKNKQWESVEHFNRVQKKWSQWGVGIVFGMAGIGILAAIAIPAYQDYVKKAKAAQQAAVDYEPPPAIEPVVANQSYATRAAPDDAWRETLIATANEVNKNLPIAVDNETRLDHSTAGPGRRFSYHYTLTTVSAPNISETQIAAFAQTIKDRACTNSDLQPFLANRTTVSYQYKDAEGNLFTKFDVTPEDCGY